MQRQVVVSRRHVLKLGVIALISAVATLCPPSPQVGRAASLLVSDRTAPFANVAAFRGQGKLAFIWHGQLYVLDGGTATLRAMSQGGTAFAPAWSPDGAWLAYLQLPDPDSIQGALWVVRADGRDAHQVMVPAQLITHFAWSPTGDVLAALPAGSTAGGNGLWVVPVGVGSAAHHRIRLARNVATRGQWVGSFSWSPDGTRLAFQNSSRQPGADVLAVVAASGGASRVVFATHVVNGQDSGIIVSGWWPNGRGLLWWLDPSYSGSIAADGMSLLSMPLASRQPRLLTWTLSYPDYLAWAPAAQRLVLVAGRGRAVYGHKALALCNVPRATCRSLLRRQDVVSLDPAWAPDGRHVAFVTAHNLGDVGGFSSDQGLLSWIRSRHLWVADSRGAGAHVLRAAGAGTFTPQWSRDGSYLLCVRDNALWLVPVHGGAAVQVARLFDTPGLPPYQSPLGGPFWRLFYYGHVAWTSLFAWYRG